MREIEKYIKRFLDECELKNYSKNTLKRYRYVLFNYFYEYLIEESGEKEIEITLNDFNPFLIKGFIFYLKQKNLSPSTIQNSLDIVKSYLRYLYNNVDEFYFDFEKLRGFNVKVPQKVKPSYTKTELERILFYIKSKIKKSKTVSAAANYLALLMLIKTGMRVNEVINLKKNDIFTEDEFLFGIKIKGKGGKYRINYIKREEFENLFEKYKLKKPESEYFLCHKKGQKLKYDNLRKTNDYMLKLLNINDKKGLHLYRHTFARNKLAEGYDIAVISQWLGHYNISVTHKYYARADESLKKQLVS